MSFKKIEEENKLKNIYQQSSSNKLKELYGSNTPVNDLQKYYGNTQENKPLQDAKVIQPNITQSNIGRTPNIVNNEKKVGLLSYIPPAKLPVQPKNDIGITGGTSIDSWYAKNLQGINSNNQKQLEEAYVNQEILKKYLPENLAKQGLSGSGLEQLYAQQANADYMNNRANINANAQNQQTDLYNAYFEKTKAEEEKKQLDDEQNIFDWYERLDETIYNKILEEADEETGKISKETRNELYKYIEDNKDNLNDHYKNLLEHYVDTNTISAEEQQKINEVKEEEIKQQQEIEKRNEVINGVKENVSENEFNNLKPLIKKYGGIDAFDFDDLWDSNKAFGLKSGKQGKRIKSMIYAAKNSQLKNGDIVDFNYGYGTDARLFYNGKFYETNSKPNCEVDDSTGKVTRNW